MCSSDLKKLDETYKLAWLRGLKTTYYLRTLGATSAEKSTVQAGSLNAVPSSGGMGMLNSAPRVSDSPNDDPTCEACQ